MRRTSSIIFLLVLTISLLSGCGSSNWEMKIDKKVDLKWPPGDSPVKVEYVGLIEGFTQQGGSLVSMLAGKSDAGKFGKPVAVAVGGDERIAVVDAMSKGVHLLVPALRKYTFLMKAADQLFESPVSVVFDDGLNLYVVDSSLKFVAIFGPDGSYRQKIEFFGKNAPGQSGKMRFGRPTALAILDTSLYVVDTARHQLHIYEIPSGRYLSSFGHRGEGKGEFNLPTHISIDDEGRLLVNDAMNFRVQLFDRDGNFLSQFGSHGDGSGDFAMSKGIAIDKWGIIYVVDTLFDTVQLFNETWDFVLTVGNRGGEPAEFWLPSGLFIDHNEKLYVCDTYNHRIQVFQLHDIAPHPGKAQASL